MSIIPIVTTGDVLRLMSPPRPARARGEEETAHGGWAPAKTGYARRPFRQSMSASTPGDDLTALIRRWRTGTPVERDRVVAAVQGDLRRIAGADMRRERRDHALQRTAHVHEAYPGRRKDQPAGWE